MASILHGSARTTPRVRAELQASKEKASVLAKRYGLSRTTVNKWRSRSGTADAPMGPRDPRSTVLTPVEEAIIVAFRQRTLLPLDDVMGCLRDQIPKLTRSSLHRCLERHGISRLPVGDTTTKRGRFADTTIGYVHIDSCEFRHADGKLHMFLAIDRVSKFTFVEFYEKAGKMNAAAFLRHAIEAFPYKIHTILTDNGIAFADLPKNRGGPTAYWSGGHIFGRTCAENGITHKLTKPYHPWTNGQAERMNRTIKDATIKVFHYPDLDSLKAHVIAFVRTYNFAKHLKALRWRTLFEAIAHAWTNDPTSFKIDPRHLIPGLNTSLRSVVDAILYIASTGCQWRQLPKEFPPYSTVQGYFYRWSRQGVFASINHLLVMAARETAGREASPTAGVIDSQSVKTVDSGGPRGFDAGKKIKGRKRHIVTDTQGNLVGLVVHAADIQDRDAAPEVLTSIRFLYPWLRHIFADGGYAGDKLRDALDGSGTWTLEIIKRSDAAKGFVLLPRRWVVERTFAWLNRCRRLAKDFEATIESATAWTLVAHLRTIIRRLARTQKTMTAF